MSKRIYPSSLKNFCLKALASPITLVFLCLSSPFLVSNTSWAQIATDKKVNVNIPQQKQENIQQDLKNIDDLMKRSAAYDDPYVINTLKKYLTSQQNKKVRIRAMTALRGIGTGAEAALPSLRAILREKNRDREVRLTSILAIRSIGAGGAVKELIDAVDDRDSTVRSAAIIGVGQVGEDAKDAILKLLFILQDPNRKEDLDVRVDATKALGKIAGKEANVVSALTQALDDPAWLIRKEAAASLQSLKGNDESADISSALPKLKEKLKDSNFTMRKSAIETLGSIGAEAKDAVPDLIKSLNDGKNKDVAAETLAKISVQVENANRKTEVNKKNISPETKDILSALADTFTIAVKQGELLFSKEVISEMVNIGNSIESKAEEVNLKDLEKVIFEFEKFSKITEEPQYKFSQDDRTRIKRQIDSLKAKKTERQFINGIIKNPSVWILAIYFASLFGMFWLRPLWLLKSENVLKRMSFKIPYLDKQVSLTAFLLMLVNHPRVLDAWVEEYVKPVREEFKAKDTVNNRKVYIPVPVVLNGKTLAQLSGKDLGSVFKKQRDFVLIQGEGGVGKTSLACQIANWAMSDDETESLCKHKMIPVLIEENLDFQLVEGVQAKDIPAMGMQQMGKQALIAAIRGQLQDLTNEQEAISEELLERLLRQRRILVIVDHFSEMSEATRKAIRPDSPDFPINALVVTSRFEETLGRVTKSTIKPLRIEGNRLSSFMEAYLTQQGKRDLFTDTEFFDACKRLSQMVGARSITVLLAKLYAEQLITTRVEEVRELPLQTPNNIPDLMLWYLNELNRSVTGDKLSDRTVQQDAKVLAWECLQQSFRPASIKREVALAALGGDNAEARLKYLEQRLHLIQTIGAAQDQIRFALDPLAEYLAALHLIERFSKNERLWQQFREKIIIIPGAPDSIKGFLLALRDCFLSERLETSLDQFIEEILGKQIDSLPATMSV